VKDFLPIAAAATNGILVGSAIVATRFVIGETAPASLALLRYLIGFLCMVPVLLLSPLPRFERRDLVPIALLGIAQFGILITLLNFALRYIPSARAALIFATSPLLTMAIAASLGRERVTLAKSLGVLATIAGVGLALGEKALQRGDAAWLGELAAFASAVTGAVCSVLYRPYVQKYRSLPVSAFAMLASVVFLAGFAFEEGFFDAMPHFSAGGWLAVLFVGLNSGVGYFLWLWALSRTTPTRVTVFLALSPVTAAALGATLLGEPVSTVSLIGLAFVALGLVLAHRPERDQRKL
jgi:drug/metabolite transporter (DMT)-like permease